MSFSLERVGWMHRRIT